MTISTGVSTNAIYRGSVVTLDWTGTTSYQRVVRSTSPTWFNVVGISGQTVSGSTSGTGGEVSIYECNPMVEFKAVTIGGVLASSNVGLRKKLAYDSTLNIQIVDLTASTAADWRVIVTGLLDAEGDSGGCVSFRFLSRLQENLGSSGYVGTSTSPVMAFYS